MKVNHSRIHIIALLFIGLVQFSSATERKGSPEAGDTPPISIGEPIEIDVEVTHEDFDTRRLKESRKENHRNPALDHYLSEKKIELPKGDYLLIAYQPVGVVSSCLIIDLEARTARMLPGTHQAGDERIVELNKSEFEYLSELVASGIMKNFPSQSGNYGFDGHSLVIYARSAETERYLSHWSPEYLGLGIFTSIFDHFKNKSNQAEVATP